LSTEKASRSSSLQASLEKTLLEPKTFSLRGTVVA
jgi:hypothetical protein